MFNNGWQAWNWHRDYKCIAFAPSLFLWFFPCDFVGTMSSGCLKWHLQWAIGCPVGSGIVCSSPNCYTDWLLTISNYDPRCVALNHKELFFLFDTVHVWREHLRAVAGWWEHRASSCLHEETALKGDHSFTVPIELARSLEENTHLNLASSFSSFSLLFLFSLFLKPVFFAFCTCVSSKNLTQ